MKLTTICYIEKDGKTLMLYRNKKKDDVHEGKYVGVGGKFEQGETPEECIIREVKEETGLTLKSLTYKGLITFPKFKDEEDWYMFLYFSDEFEGVLSEQDLDDCKEGKLLWVDNDKIFDLNMWEGDRLFLDWAKKGKIFSAKITYDNGKLKDYSVNFLN
nr:8-oxo-dGTP diphosphatase [Clostridioides difficile]